jgi:hypothetical protein
MRDFSSRFGFPRGVGYWRQWPCGNQPRRHADALFALSLLGTTLDRRTRWAETADDLPARQGADEHVPPLLSRRPGFLTALIPNLYPYEVTKRQDPGR